MISVVTVFYRQSLLISISAGSISKSECQRGAQTKPFRWQRLQFNAASPAQRWHQWRHENWNEGGNDLHIVAGGLEARSSWFNFEENSIEFRGYHCVGEQRSSWSDFLWFKLISAFIQGGRRRLSRATDNCVCSPCRRLSDAFYHGNSNSSSFSFHSSWTEDSWLGLSWSRSIDCHAHVESTFPQHRI